MENPTLKDIYDIIERFREEVHGSYVTKDEFGPVKAIAFSFVAIVTISVLTAILTTVIKAKV